MSTISGWRAVRDQLKARRVAINQEIAAYPAPITGCDAQFNHLLEERRGISADLKRLDAVRDDGAALYQFVQSCNFLRAAAKEVQT